MRVHDRRPPWKCEPRLPLEGLVAHGVLVALRLRLHGPDLGAQEPRRDHAGVPHEAHLHGLIAAAELDLVFPELRAIGLQAEELNLVRGVPQAFGFLDQVLSGLLAGRPSDPPPLRFRVPARRGRRRTQRRGSGGTSGTRRLRAAYGNSWRNCASSMSRAEGARFRGVEDARFMVVFGNEIRHCTLADVVRGGPTERRNVRCPWWWAGSVQGKHRAHTGVQTVVHV
mmetsp:Transcript_41833/g.120882  ORF Transcript_41833/g.120882 Transcript_41833/m.120882 type:complete len:226 (+) Transcript_41833:215-892(+)